MSVRKGLLTALLAGCLFAFVLLGDGSAQEAGEGMRPGRPRREQTGARGRGRPQAFQRERRGDEEFRARMREMDLEEREMDLDQRRAEMKFEHQARMQKLAAARERGGHGDGGRPGWKGGKGKLPLGHLRVLCPLIAMIHVLLAVWAYQDLQKRKTGSGIWIVLLLLGGIPAAIAYGIVRIPEMRTSGQ